MRLDRLFMWLLSADGQRIREERRRRELDRKRLRDEERRRWREEDRRKRKEAEKFKKGDKPSEKDKDQAKEVPKIKVWKGEEILSNYWTVWYRWSRRITHCSFHVYAVSVSVQLLRKPDRGDDVEKPKEKLKKPEKDKMKDDRAPGCPDMTKRQNFETREDRVSRKWGVITIHLLDVTGL